MAFFIEAGRPCRLGLQKRIELTNFSLRQARDATRRDGEGQFQVE